MKSPKSHTLCIAICALALTRMVFLSQSEFPLRKLLLIENNTSSHVVNTNNEVSTANGTLPITCSEKGMRLLTNVIKSDQEHFGLRPWSSFDERHNEHIYFPGLDSDLMDSSIRGRRIVLFGDSTLRNMNMWLHKLLNTNNSTVLSSLATMDLSEANVNLVNDTWKKCRMSNTGRGELTCNGIPKMPETQLADGTEVRFIWGPKFTDDQCPEFESSYNLMKTLRPQIVIANMGLWWLHFQEMGRNQQGCVAETWVNYEQWLENTLLAAEEAGAEHLIFKTTNAICSEKYTNKYDRAHRSYSSKEDKTIKECFDSIRSNSSSIMTNVDVFDYCNHGTFNDIGSDHLNQRLFKFVKAKIGKARRRTASIKISVLNDHAIQSCDYTVQKDGRHYQRLNLARIRLLGNILSCN